MTMYISQDYVYITGLECEEIHRGLSIFASQVSDSLSFISPWADLIKFLLYKIQLGLGTSSKT